MHELGLTKGGTLKLKLILCGKVAKYIRICVFTINEVVSKLDKADLITEGDGKKARQ